MELSSYGAARRDYTSGGIMVEKNLYLCSLLSQARYECVSQNAIQIPHLEKLFYMTCVSVNLKT